MRVERIGGHNIAVFDSSTFLKNEAVVNNPEEPIKWAVHTRKSLIKSVTNASESNQIISSVYSMDKLLGMYDKDEYVSGCIDALATWTLQQIQCTNPELTNWFRNPENEENPLETLQEALKYLSLCGNAFLLKVRNSMDQTGQTQGSAPTGRKQWVGLTRLLPSEIRLIERYEHGYPKPMYLQTRKGVQTIFPNEDVIHMKIKHKSSNLWGVASLSVALNVEILSEIKQYDYNNFKNGLMIDYFLIVEGGSLRDNMIVGDDPNTTTVEDAYTLIQQALQAGTGNKASHGTILIESENPQVKIRLEKIRQDLPEGGFQNLKKDLREGIFARYRVPPRLVSQVHAGAIGGGGEVEGQMKSFYFGVVNPEQKRLGWYLAREFRSEFGWDADENSFNFGNLEELWMSSSDRLFQG